MPKGKRTVQSNLPKFANEAEAAAFWDTHSPEDFPEDFEDAEVVFSRRLIRRGLTLRLNDDVLSKLNNMAEQQGVAPSALVRRWIQEHLSGETLSPSNRRPA